MVFRTSILTRPGYAARWRLVAAVPIGLVPFGGLVVSTLVANGILAQGTPVAREGLATTKRCAGRSGRNRPT